MLYNININQVAIMTNFPNTKLKLNHFAILDVISKLRDWDNVQKYIIECQEYIWASTIIIAQQLPILDVSERQIKRYILDLVDEGFLIRSSQNEKNSKMLIGIGVNFSKALFLNTTNQVDKNVQTGGQKCLPQVDKNVYHNLNDYNSINNNKRKEIMTIGAIVDTDKGNLFEEVLSAVEVNIYTEPHYRRPAVKTSILPFDEFWLLYNKSNSKAAVKKKYEKIKEADRQKIKEHLPKYILSTPDKIYRKNALTYLNQECWEDEVVVKNDNLNTAENSNYKTPPKNNRLMM